MNNPTVSKSRSQTESVSGKSTRRSVNITKMYSKGLDRMERHHWNYNFAFKHQGGAENYGKYRSSTRLNSVLS